MQSTAAVAVSSPSPPPDAPWKRSTLMRERQWRYPPVEIGRLGILATRWCDDRTLRRQESSPAADRHYVLAVALRPAKIRLSDAHGDILEGTMPTGMLHVSEPGQAITATFASPCDFVHFHVDHDQMSQRRAAIGMPCGSFRNLLLRDDLSAKLARTLTTEAAGGDPCYAASVGQTILTRLLTLRQTPIRVRPLATWRLRRVQSYLAANIAEPVRLEDLANAAGLSRMHFAAQFRAATGCRPHQYVLQQRIEHAKQLLARTDRPIVQVALDAGFQTQSHFSTVFKRLSGETPMQWQRSR